MKKHSIVLSALLLHVAATATDFDYEATALIGGVFPEADFTVKNQLMNGFELQANHLSVAGIKPELSVLYSHATDYRRVEGASTSITRVGLNGIYEMPTDTLTPFVKAGGGYEFLYKHYDGYADGVFLDAGAGVKVPLADAWDLKVEALYLVKYRDEPHYKSHFDNNAIVMAGINYKFGSAPAPVQAEPQAPAPQAKPVVQAPVQPATPATPATPVAPAPTKPLDSDQDGVIDANDRCPNTPAWASVDHEGCPIKRTLRLNFALDSATITQADQAELRAFADFLKKERYDLHIIGHTDDLGSAIYNQKLSEKRATSVKKALVAEGIDASRMRTSGQGEAAPLKPNTSKTNRDFNRRVEVDLITPKH